ncbi:putative RNA-binding protein eif1ad [Mortierella sp. GBA43]|nr:putative RNA-binding protein eif1ad [Mortierella sp. GBA43]
MSRRKQAPADILTDLPEIEEGQQFARVIATRGNNVHEVQFPDGREILANLPPKFRSLVWVKRGSYVIIQSAEEEDKTKVEGDIVAVLFPDHIKRYKQDGAWPFGDHFSTTDEAAQGDSSDGESDNDDDLFVNNNRIVIEESDSESESESESDNDDDDDDENKQK